MTLHDHELLDPRTWLERVQRFLDGLSEGAVSPERQLRQAYHLVRLAPEMVSRSLPAPVAEDEFEAMLADAKFDAAVRTFLGPNFAGARTEAGPAECESLIDDSSLTILRAWAGSFMPPQPQLH